MLTRGACLPAFLPGLLLILDGGGVAFFFMNHHGSSEEAKRRASRASLCMTRCLDGRSRLYCIVDLRLAVLHGRHALPTACPPAPNKDLLGPEWSRWHSQSP